MMLDFNLLILNTKIALNHGTLQVLMRENNVKVFIFLGSLGFLSQFSKLFYLIK